MIWVERLISFAVLLQSLELFFIKPWPAEVLSTEIPRPLLRLYKPILYIQALAAGASLLFPTPWGFALQLICVWLVAVRWRGTFNGGSDFMTIQLLLASLLAAAHPQWEGACRYYVSFQILFSYAVAGFAKLRTPEWRNGQLLPRFIGSRAQSLLLLSWLAIGFECVAPLSLLNPRVCCAHLTVGALFHLINFYYFGLNRFFFVWIAGYPAILLTALRLA